jgi:hypothetical protein
MLTTTDTAGTVENIGHGGRGEKRKKTRHSRERGNPARTFRREAPQEKPPS